jgi:hypothetical protein
MSKASMKAAFSYQLPLLRFNMPDGKDIADWEHCYAGSMNLFKPGQESFVLRR